MVRDIPITRTRVSIHINHNLTPHRLRIILTRLSDGADLSFLAADCGLSEKVLRKVVLPAIRGIGFLEMEGNRLSPSGYQFAQLANLLPDRFPEAAHLWMYTAHIFDQTRTTSWAYAQIVDNLWTSYEQELKAIALSQLASAVIEKAAQALGLSADTLAFSDRSVRGALNWLQSMSPPVLSYQNGVRIFRRRFFCPGITFLWAVDFFYRSLAVPYGVRMFLTPERLEQICRLCILDPSGVDNVLTTAKQMSDYDRGGLFDVGTEGGLGRWILLARPLPVPKLPEEE